MLTIPNPVLQAMLSTGLTHEIDGSEISLQSQVRTEYVNALYLAILHHKPKLVIEVGLAYGTTALAILTALEQVGGEGRLISIDPVQRERFHDVGVENVRRAGLAKRHELRQTYDYFALPQMLSEGLSVDFAYIDGWHTFDYTLLDFFYIDKMLNAGGVIGFNDCGYRAVRRVLKFVESHRKYRPLEVGLPRDYVASNFAKSIVRRAMRFGVEDRYFLKIENWEPDWNFYAPF